ncbi:anti-sigma-28 factor, FlgM family [Methylophilus rhizosphaerae]|uniref:Negative regulator of flagellin synthesis n=1 Tax=Methylophilus rhizosphaerae TaxID=492660 RepID=A0A1G8ZBI8_9PROT|nr:flagellar biosynthesis anti-sigma factor FlgM [Methylophilus rhizosphaerae]SDK12313.1 anti-sigma-28 factor, FlgM family [Methylophilus rhizosphaerae]
MNISDSIKKLGTTGVDKTALDKNAGSNRSDKAGAATSQQPGTDNVTLSAASVQLQSLESGLASGEVFDANKVDEIKAAIARGDFSVDTAKVADGLLQTVKDLIQPNKG